MFKRLTKLKGNYVCWNGNQDYSTRDRYAKVLDRLAAYEDTGLTPAQVEAMKMDMEQLRADNINAEMNLAHMTADKDEQAKRIMELEKALKKIANPITYMRKEAESSGCALNGMMAIRLSEDPHYYREIAQKAIDALLGGKEDEK